MENRVEFLALLIGLNKLGVTIGLINTNLNGRPLAHCVNVTNSKKCIFGAEVAARMEEVKAELSLSEGEDYYVVADGKTRHHSTGPSTWVARATMRLAIILPTRWKPPSERQRSTFLLLERRACLRPLCFQTVVT